MRALWPLLLSVAAISISDAAVVGEWRVNLLRGSVVLAPTNNGATEAAAWAACQARIQQSVAARQEYTCQTPRYVAMVTTSAPPPVPTPQPVPETRPGVCPGATTGSWTQTRVYVAAPAPTYWAAGPWLPADPPAGVCVAIVPTGTVTLTWAPPTQNTDGSSLTNLASYKLYYGQTPAALSRIATISNPALTTYVLEDLAAGPWYVRLAAVNAAGVPSVLSNMAMKTVP